MESEFSVVAMDMSGCLPLWVNQLHVEHVPEKS